MQFSRNLSIKINFILNELLPPILRDSKWFMYILFRLAFKDRAGLFMNFRRRAYEMSEKEYRQAYADTSSCHLQKGSDLNEQCLQRIVRELKAPNAERGGDTVLEVGCGRGLLLQVLHREYPELKFAATDIVCPDALGGMSWLQFTEASSEQLPFADNHFDTVICSHVLEHVRDLEAAMSELRRVCRGRLMIVLPRERSYRFAFNLHLHFFPYRFAVMQRIARGSGGVPVECRPEGGDWFYLEDRRPASC